MAKRRGYTPKQKQEEKEAEVVVEPTVAKRNLLPYWIVFALGFLLYANTIPFDYALDDKLYITANSFTKKGIEGLGDIWTNDLMTGFFGTKKNLVEGGRYRPLALTTHALEWEWFGESPQLSHFFNVVLYGLIGVVLLSVLKRIFPWREEKWSLTVPFVATILFLAHPLHTEVAANIKSRDEIMSLLFALLAFRAVLSYLEQKETKDLMLSGLWFLLSLFSKESTVTFLGVIPLTLVFFPKASLRESVMAMVPIAAMTLVYLAVRWTVFDDQGGSLKVASELMNKPYLLASEDQRLASIFFTMGLYLKLLVWPHPLTHDYYPFHPFRTYEELASGVSPYYDWSNPWAILSAAAYAIILGYGIYALVKRVKGGPASVVGYAALIYFGTFILFSNLFFDIGAFMNERFLFIPSLGFTLLIAHLLVERLQPRFGERVVTVVLALVLVGYAGRTIVRNYAWENDWALASSDVHTSDGSAKIKMTMGSELLDQAKAEANPHEKERLLNEAEQYCLRSLEIHPTYFPPLDILGNIYFEKENFTYSLHYFSQAVKMKPKDERMLTNLEAVGNVATQKGAYEEADKAYRLLTRLRQGKDLSRIYAALGELHGKHLQDMGRSKKFLRKAISADPSNAAAHQKIGIVYAMTGQADSALQSFNRSLDLDPDNARVLLNLGILHKQLGDLQKGEQYMQQAKAIDPNVLQGGN